MRCPACQVDLNGNAALCPLCGGPAEDISPLIEGVACQDYPRYATKRFRRIPSLAVCYRANGGISTGNFLLGVVCTAALPLFWFGYARGLPVTAILASGMAIVTLGAISALLLATLLPCRRRESHLGPVIFHSAFSRGIRRGPVGWSDSSPALGAFCLRARAFAGQPCRFVRFLRKKPLDGV